MVVLKMVVVMMVLNMMVVVVMVVMTSMTTTTNSSVSWSAKLMYLFSKFSGYVTASELFTGFDTTAKFIILFVLDLFLLYCYFLNNLFAFYRYTMMVETFVIKL
jgi:hypothetical protein